MSFNKALGARANNAIHSFLMEVNSGEVLSNLCNIDKATYAQAKT
jgi:hypothetical protein